MPGGGRRKTSRFTDAFSSPQAQIDRGHSQAAQSRGRSDTKLHRKARLHEGREAARNLVEGTIRKNKASQRRASFNDGIERIVRGVSGGD